VAHKTVTPGRSLLRLHDITSQQTVILLHSYCRESCKSRNAYYCSWRMYGCNKLCTEFGRVFITLQYSKKEEIKYFARNTPI